MASNNSIKKTLIVAFALCIVCSVIASTPGYDHTPRTSFVSSRSTIPAHTSARSMPPPLISHTVTPHQAGAPPPPSEWMDAPRRPCSLERARERERGTRTHTYI